MSGNLVSEPSICDQLLFVQLITLRLVTDETEEVALLIFAMGRCARAALCKVRASLKSFVGNAIITRRERKGKNFSSLLAV